MTARLALATPPLILTEQDRQLIASARAAFRNDFRYLEQLLWQARARRTTADSAADGPYPETGVTGS